MPNAMGTYIISRVCRSFIKYGPSFHSPYDNRWSKTMIGYGSEHTHFIMELTYNYGIPSYALGNYDNNSKFE